MNFNESNYQKNNTNNLSIKIEEIIEKNNKNNNNTIDALNIIIKHINDYNNLINNDLQKIMLEYNQLKNDIEILKKENFDLKNKLNKINKENINSKSNIDSKNIKALNIHQNIYEYNKYVENLYKVSKWEIRPETYEERAKKLSKFSYWNILKNEFNEKKLTNKNLNDSQLVTYFDTMYLMYQLLNEITNEKIKNEMKIIQEYRIDTLNKPRIDYLLTYRNDIILLEFGKSTPKDLSKSLTEKQRQLDGYKNALINNLENNEKYKITSIPIIYLSEENETNKNNNADALRSALKQINKALKNQKDAFEQLQDIE